MTLPEQDILSARILIVDEQAPNVHLLTRLLLESGYTDVQSCLEPQQVCAMHRMHDYDLILLAVQMPLMDGFEVMAALQANSGGDDLPIIALTAQPDHKLQALQAGAKDFVSKPFDQLDVKIRIRNMLEMRLLYSRLEAHKELLEQTVLMRTAQLRESEARYRSLTELASDWYWGTGRKRKFHQGFRARARECWACLWTRWMAAPPKPQNRGPRRGGTKRSAVPCAQPSPPTGRFLTSRSTASTRMVRASSFMSAENPSSALLAAFWVTAASAWKPPCGRAQKSDGRPVASLVAPHDQVAYLRGSFSAASPLNGAPMARPNDSRALSSSGVFSSAAIASSSALLD